MINNILNDYARLYNVQNQMATGQKVNKPSDNALATNEALRLDAVIARTRQYNTNIISGNSFLSLSDGTLSNMHALLNSAKSLTVSSASETTTHEMRQANTVEIQSTLTEIISLANAEEAGRYLFGGTETTEPPYEIVGTRYVYYKGNEESIKIQSDAATYTNINSTGSEVFGSMTSTLMSEDLSPKLSLSSSYSTRLDDLNNGLGIPAGSINIRYSAYPDNGINIDLSDCDTLADVAEKIEAETKAASAELNPKKTAGAPVSYIAQRYIKVELNPDGNGIQLIETDPIWETTADLPDKRPPDYPAFTNPSSLEVTDVGGGLVATRLGISGEVNYTVDPLNISKVIPTPLVGVDVDAALTKNTLLCNLKNYVDRPFTITNGALPNKVGIIEIDDSANNFSNWTLNGLDSGINTDKDGGLYVRMEETASGSGEYYLRIYKNDSYLSKDLVAQSTEVLTSPVNVGLIAIDEQNQSGITGSVQMPAVSLPTPPTTLQAQFDESFSATISVPAFIQELQESEYHNVTDEFRLSGMMRGRDPQDKGDDTCSYDGEFYMEVSNSYTGVVSGDPTGQMQSANINTANLVRGFDTDANGDVYLRMDGANTIGVYSDSTYTTLVANATWNVGDSSVSFTSVGGHNFTGTMSVEDAGALPVVGSEAKLSIESNVEVNVYNSATAPRSLIATGTLPEGAESGMVDLKGTDNFSYLSGSVYVDWTKNLNPSTGFEYFQSDGVTPQDKITYDMTSTFNTVEDLMNAVNSSNTYTTASIDDDGNSLNITSHLAGAHMIVTESMNRINHYNDNGQLGEINLTSIINDFNTEFDGKIYSNITTKTGDTVTIGAATCTKYTTTVELFNNTPTDDDFDEETDLVGSTKSEAAYDASTNTWYQYDSINGTWNSVSNYPQNTALSITQSNHSGLNGTLELNSIRLPQPPYTETTYFDPDAAAGQKNLSAAIVIDTKSSVFNNNIDGAGSSYGFLDYSEITNALQGINTDDDGNLYVTTGFKVTNDTDEQLNKLELRGIIDGTNTDANGELFAVTSYAIENDNSSASGGRQINQLSLKNFTRGNESTLDGKIYAQIDTGTGFINFYNDDPNAIPSTATLVGRGTIAAFPAQVTITPQNGYKLTGSLYLDGGVSDDGNIVIDLNRGSVMMYEDSTLNPNTLVAAGNSDSNGDVELLEENSSGISGEALLPAPGGKQDISFDNNITIDTRERQLIAYSDADYIHRVATGSFSQFAGGEVDLTALNSSKLGGSMYFNSVVESTDTAKQIQNLSLDGIKLGVNTNVNGQLYMEVTENPPASGTWEVNVFTTDDPAIAGNRVATGTIDMDTGIVTLTQDNASGISGSLKVADPPAWYPTAQNTAGGLVQIDVSGQDNDLVVSPQRGLQNSGENREENIFTTLNDVMDAMNNDDVEKLHDLLENFETDHNRILTARANIGTRIDRLDLLTSRHEDEIINFVTLRSERIDLDYSSAVVEYQTAQNVFDAALKTTAQIMPMSLVDYV